MDAETADLLFGLGRAQFATIQRHEMRKAVATLRRACDYYVDIEDVPKAVAVAEFPLQGGNINMGRAELVSLPLSLVAAGSHQAGRLLFLYGFLVYQERGDYEGARESLDQALSIALRERDEALQLRTLVALGHVEAYHLRFQESLQYDLRAIELANRVDDPFQETHAHLEVASVLHHLGDLEGARRHAAALLTGAERLRNRIRLSQALDCNMAIAMLEGNWQAARALSERCLAETPRSPHSLCYRAIMEYTLGDSKQGEAHLERLLDVMRVTPPGSTSDYAFTAMAIPMVAQITGMDQQPEVAEAAAQVVLSSPGVMPVHASIVRIVLALLASRRGDITAARERSSTAITSFRPLRPPCRQTPLMTSKMTRMWSW